MISRGKVKGFINHVPTLYLYNSIQFGFELHDALFLPMWEWLDDLWRALRALRTDEKSHLKRPDSSYIVYSQYSVMQLRQEICLSNLSTYLLCWRFISPCACQIIVSLWLCCMGLSHGWLFLNSRQFDVKTEGIVTILYCCYRKLDDKNSSIPTWMAYPFVK